jgi:hypothetical protein
LEFPGFGDIFANPNCYCEFLVDACLPIFRNSTPFFRYGGPFFRNGTPNIRKYVAEYGDFTHFFVS